MATYCIDDLTFTYPDRPSPALTGVSLTIEAGDFVVLCGDSGGGKTTLLRHLKPVLTPHGERSGTVYFAGRPIQEGDPRELARLIGYVGQNPDNQAVTDKVWHELAFGLESLGLSNPDIRLRVAEMATFFGIESWFDRAVNELSGGQKQLVNLAGVLALQPEVLVLDEPTAQLDPIAAADFLAALKRINLELGVSVVLSEHRLEDAFPLADQVVVLRGGTVVNQGTPGEVSARAAEFDPRFLRSLPTAARIHAALGGTGRVPLTVRDGRRYLSRFTPAPAQAPVATPPVSRRSPRRRGPAEPEPALRLDEVWFRYRKDGPDVLRGLSLRVPTGGLFALMGGNGAGKSTALGVLAGLREPYRGRSWVGGQRRDRRPASLQVTLLPQNPQAVFLAKTVQRDLLGSVPGRHSGEDREAQVAAVADLVGISGLLGAHPYDLSGGEQQRAALAKALLTQPDVLLLDEPTKGLDAAFKEKLAEILAELTGSGMTVVMASHDVEFCARYADQCALLFRGELTSSGPPGSFFAGHSFYTTAANRIARAHWPEAITLAEVVDRCRDAQLLPAS